MKGVNDKKDRKTLFDLVTHPDRPVMRTLALLGGIAGAVGLVTTVLTLRASNDETVKSGAPSGAVTGSGAGGKGRSPLEEVAALSTGVQLRKFVELLGEPDRKRDVLDSQFKPSSHNESIWQRPSYVLQAVTDSKDTVVLYTVTTMDKNFHPEIPFRLGKDSGPLRLGLSKFADVDQTFIGIDAIYPANARYFYSEAYGGGGAFQHRTMLLTQSWDATGIAPFDSSSGQFSVFDDFQLVSLACSEFKPCHTLPAREAEALKRLRAALVISGFTITEPNFDLRSIAVVPNPDILNSRCELPVGCN
jgi:hypothetical protein